MSAAKKFKDNYPRERKKEVEQDTETLKKEINILREKIAQELKEPEKQKKAAQIIANLLKK